MPNATARCEKLKKVACTTGAVTAPIAAARAGK